jgi:hypothetical protein
MALILDISMKANPTVFSITLTKLTQFLKRAKLETFASGKKAEKNGFIRTFNYKEESWEYQDRYAGSIVDVGMEIVTYTEIPIWGMSYMGGIRTDNDSIEYAQKTFDFLKIALQQIDDTIPARGRSEFVLGDWVYKNEIKGNLQSFHGQETILLRGRLIYQRQYQGGVIKEKLVKFFIH